MCGCSTPLGVTHCKCNSATTVDNVQKFDLMHACIPINQGQPKHEFLILLF